VQADAPIPGGLRSFLAEVSALIATGDESATIESDDLLQCADCYGGLVDPERGTYAFTFFPGAGTRRKWIFELTADEIAAVASGARTSLALWGCPDPECGAMFARPDDLCFYCDYADDAP